MKTAFWALVIIVIVLALIRWAQTEGPISGGACPSIGTTQIDKRGQEWTCIRNVQTGNGFWYRGKP